MKSSPRVPVLLQQTPTECGPACLAMVMNAFGHRLTVEDCVEAAGTGRDGASARTLIRAATALGGQARALSVADHRLPGVAVPAIVHWRFNHFVVVERVRRHGVVIVDPGRGRRHVNHEEFSDGFTGVVVEVRQAEHISPGSDPPPSGVRMMMSMLSRVPAVRSLSAQLLLAALVLQLLAVAPAVVSLVVFNQILPFGLTEVISSALIAVGILVIVRFVVSLSRSSMLLTLQNRADRTLTDRALETILGLRYNFFEGRGHGDTVMRLMSTATIRQALGLQALGAILDLLVSVGYVAVLAVVAWWALIVAGGLGVAQIVLVLGISRWLQPRIDEELHDQASTQNAMVEVVAAMSTIKANASEPVVLARLRDAHERQLVSGLRRGRVGAIGEALVGSLQVAAPLVIVLWGTERVVNGNSSVGALVAASLLGALLMSSLASSVASVQQLLLVSRIADRLADLFRQPLEQPDPNLPRWGRLSGSLDVRGLQIRYGAHAAPVVDGVSFRIEPGQMLAIVGPSGAGKSTLLKALIGLLEPSAGSICYDGQEMRGRDLGSLRRQLGVVLQEVAIFAGTVRDNIAFDDPDVSQAEVERAAAQACLLGDVLAMPMGFDTQVGEGGVSLSGGQRQRLAIARALLRRPSIMFLDEATSHLDIRTEAAVAQALESLDCTRIVIAHRMSTVRAANQILVLDAGKIAQAGTHEDLLSVEGVYGSLVAPQQVC